MAGEARITSGLGIRADNIQYQSQPQAFQADVTGRKGPTPGALTIPVYGKVIDLGELSTPGLCRVQNLDATNYITIGMYNPITDIFTPFMELLPGESYVFRFSRNIQEQYTGQTGTGTTGQINRMLAMANFAPAVLLVEAFEA